MIDLASDEAAILTGLAAALVACVLRPLWPGDLHHTLFHVLGVDPKVNFLDHSGRPIPAIDHGAVIGELV